MMNFDIISRSDRAVHLKASDANLFPTTSIGDYKSE